MSAEAGHGPGCGCTRCVGFQPGHEIGVRHGAYATVKLQPRAAEIAETLRARVPGGDPTDDVAVEVTAMALARLERAMAALDEVDAAAGERALSAYVGKADESLARLRQDARGWTNTVIRLLDALALTPTARGRLGADVARARSTDLTRLSDRQLAQLEALVQAATEDDGDA